MFNTIIIGAGISGLACANYLEKNDDEFLVISKDIGGRILTSETGDVNYGAFFICSDYNHVLNYVSVNKRIRLKDFYFHENEHIYSLFEPRIIPYISQFIKIDRILLKFRNHLHRMRKKTRMISQKSAIEQDKFLYELYNKNAYQYVVEQNLMEGSNVYLSKALYSTTFSPLNNMNAFSFLQFLLPLITPIYTFTFEKEKMIHRFQDRIHIATVKDIQYKDNFYRVKTDNKSFKAANIVLATDITWSYKFAHVKIYNKPVQTNMIHIRGKMTGVYKNKYYHLFSSTSNVQAIADLCDGTFLFYYKKDVSSLHDYFSNFNIIYKKQWNPAGTINGHHLIESDRGNNMYLIGDYNIAGLEDSFITGIYGAHKIIQQNQ